ncbi:MAG TPA: hypothetical protein VEY91_13515 [Candidatus Limnocylindria bacterium]|nr:hypothetical protein [Candidatus Limnocylindria bacterium]
MMLRTSVFSVALLLCASSAPAAPWFEIGDAGNLPASAQTTIGAGALTVIQGTLAANNDQDMYCIRVSDPQAFVASLNCVAFDNNDLWLFDVAANGVRGNDGCTGGQTNVGPGVTLAGTYYLAVSPSGDDALNGAAPIWNPPSVGTQRSPDGAGAPGPVSGWSNAGVVSSFNNYTIQLAGCAFCDTATPATSDTWGRLKLIYR